MKLKNLIEERINWDSSEFLSLDQKKEIEKCLGYPFDSIVYSRKKDNNLYYHRLSDILKTQKNFTQFRQTQGVLNIAEVGGYRILKYYDKSTDNSYLATAISALPMLNNLIRGDIIA